MKKLVLPLIVAIAAIVAAVLLITRHSAHSTRLAEVLPAETVAFFHAPNLERSRERWKKTALYQILHEPEVQVFLERPRSQLPAREETERRRAQFARLDPREAFLAVTSINQANIPTFIAGFSYRGKRDEAAGLLKELRAGLQKEWPAGKSDVVRAGIHEIETFSHGNLTAAAVLREDWLLLADDLDLLKATLARFDGQPGPALRDNNNFRVAVSRLPMDFDMLSFVQTKELVSRLVALVAMTNSSASPQQLEELKKIEALAATTKMDGGHFRDSLFVFKPGEAKKGAMARQALALSSTNTLLYYGALWQPPAGAQLPGGVLGSLQSLPALTPYLNGLQQRGLTFADAAKAFGPEVTLLTDWPPSAQIPGLLAAVDVRDQTKARQFVAVLTQDAAGLAWARQVVDGVEYYQLPAIGLPMLSFTPTVALSDRFLLTGISYDSVKAALARLNTKAEGLEAAAGYKDAMGAVQSPSTLFGYVDSKALFERLYGMLRPFAMIWGPGVGKGTASFIDFSKLPATETIARHLSSMVVSQSAEQDGFLSESVGPITLTQALFGFGMSAGWAAMPMLKQFDPAGPLTLPPATNLTPSPAITPAPPVAPSRPASTP